MQQSYDTNNGCAPSILPNVAMDDIASLHTLLDGALGCKPDGGAIDGGECTTAPDLGASLCKMVHRDPDAATDAGTDALSDSQSDAPADGRDFDTPADGDGSTCKVAPVWRDFSHFSFRSVAFASPPPPDGRCIGAQEIYELSLETKSLRQSGCIFARETERRIDLTDAQVDQIVARLSAMRTTCTTTCGSADIQGGFSFDDCNDNGLGSFTGNAESPCGLPPSEPWVDTNDIFDLRLFFGSLVTQACAANADAGSSGVCAPRCRELIR